jgi:hypothetical protein
MLAKGAIAFYVIICGSMYAASYHLNSLDKRLAPSDRSLLLQIIVFAFTQFVFGYVSGLVIMHMYIRYTATRVAKTKEASTTTTKSSCAYTILPDDDV